MKKPSYIILICFVAFVRSTIAQTKPQLDVRLDQSNGLAYIRLFYPELQVDLNGNDQLFPTELFSHPVGTDPFQLNNRQVSDKNNK